MMASGENRLLPTMSRQMPVLAQSPNKPKLPCDQPSTTASSAASSGNQLSTGVQLNLSTVVGSGTSSGVSYQSVPGSTTTNYSYTGSGVGFDPGVSVQSVWALGNGTWTGTFQNWNFSFGVLTGSYFQTPGSGGWSGISFGLTAGPKGFGGSYTETNYTCNNGP